MTSTTTDIPTTTKGRKAKAAPPEAPTVTQLHVDDVPARPTPPPPPPSTHAQLLTVRVDAVDESPLNYRLVFRGVEELAQSIREVGLQQPVMVRPHPHEPERWELVYGARRLRACRMAELETIQAKVLPLTDAQVREAQLVENGQRDNTHPLEEASAYDAMIKLDGHTTASIAQRIGKSIEYVQKRLKLGSLEPEVREAFLADRMDVGVAIIIARIPYRAGQLEALKRLADEDDGTGRSTTREAQEWVRRHVMLKLAEAPFDPRDGQLVALAGSCTVCVKNTKASTPLFAEVEDSDGLCTDKPCWERKAAAHWEVIATQAVAEGKQVLAAEEASKVFDAWSGNEGTRYGAAYVSLDDEPNRVGSWDQGKRTVRDVLGDKVQELPVVLAQNPRTGKVHRLVDAKVVMTVLAGGEPLTGKAAERAAKAEQDAAVRRRREMEMDRARELAERKARAEVIARKPPSWRTLARLVLVEGGGLGESMIETVGKLYNVDLDPNSKGIPDDTMVQVWETGTKHLTEGQLAATIILTLDVVHDERARAELERAYPTMKAAVAKGATKSVEATKAERKQRSASAVKGAKAAAAVKGTKASPKAKGKGKGR